MEEPKVAALVHDDFRTPDIPPHLQRCIERTRTIKLPKAPPAKPKEKQPPKDDGDKPRRPPVTDTADGLVIDQLADAEERKACYAAMLKWYKALQEAERKAKAARAEPAKPAAPEPPRTISDLLKGWP